MNVQARSIGPVAKRLMISAGTGEILASFARSLHIAVGPNLICIVDEALGNGPLNITLPASAIAGLTGLPAGTACSIARCALHFSDTVLVDTSYAAPWSPPQAGPWASAAERLKLWAFVRCEGSMRAPHDSFFHAACAEPAPSDTLLLRAARQRLGRVMHWAEHPTGAPPLYGLMGLGHGLTPAGDDVIGGMAMAFHAWQNHGLRAAFAEAIANGPDHTTTLISAALLDAAAQGFGHEALHAVMLAIQMGQADKLENDLRRISAIGDSSGWDGLAGILIGIALCEGWRISDHWRGRQKLTAA